MTVRRPIVGGNWKMNTDLATAVELAETVVADCNALVESCDIVLFPPFPYLQAVGRAMGHHAMVLGAQDVYRAANGAFTGEVSAEMLLDLNVQAVLVGHSERRHVMGENDELINAKARRAVESGLHLVLCIGETMAQREAGTTEQVNIDQLTAGLEGLDYEDVRRLVTIAYEPVWAIGTGLTATPDDAEAVHQMIRTTLSGLYDMELAEAIRIQYGGSVNASNAKDLFAQPNIDGGLIGGASLRPNDFTAIVRAAAAN